VADSALATVSDMKASVKVASQTAFAGILHCVAGKSKWVGGRAGRGKINS
jgi:hypothetical protein